MFNLADKLEINTLVSKGNVLGISFHAQCQGENLSVYKFYISFDCKN